MELINREKAMSSMNYAMFNTVYQSYATNIIKMEEKVDPHSCCGCYCYECKFSTPSEYDFQKILTISRR